MANTWQSVSLRWFAGKNWVGVPPSGGNHRLIVLGVGPPCIATWRRVTPGSSKGALSIAQNPCTRGELRRQFERRNYKRDPAVFLI